MAWLTSFFGHIFAGLGWIVLIAAIAVAVAVRVFGSLIPAWVSPLVIALLGVAFVGNNVLKNEQIADMRTQRDAAVLAHGETKTQNAEAWAKQARLDAEAERAVSVLLAATQARQGELNAEIAKSHRKTAEAQSVAATASARERATRGQLRDEIVRRAAAERESRGHQSELADSVAGSPSAETAALVCAHMLGRIDERAGELAAFADATRVAGHACEREYDAAVKVSNSRADVPGQESPSQPDAGALEIPQ